MSAAVTVGDVGDDPPGAGRACIRLWTALVAGLNQSREVLGSQLVWARTSRRGPTAVTIWLSLPVVWGTVTVAAAPVRWSAWR
jgi:hypothetical protein